MRTLTCTAAPSHSDPIEALAVARQLAREGLDTRGVVEAALALIAKPSSPDTKGHHP